MALGPRQKNLRPDSDKPWTAQQLGTAPKINVRQGSVVTIS
jgi:hypothetical protein